MLPSLEEPLQLRDNLRLTPNTPSGLWPASASGREQHPRQSFAEARPIQSSSPAGHADDRLERLVSFMNVLVQKHLS
jgi:hypothetical protein